MQMEKKGSRKKMKNPNRSRIIALACCVLLLVSALISGGFAKYTTQVQSSGEGLPFKAQLFDESQGGEFKLEELEGTMEADGAQNNMDGTILSGDSGIWFSQGNFITQYEQMAQVSEPEFSIMGIADPWSPP